MGITLDTSWTVFYWHFSFHLLCSLIEGCKNFSLLQREKKVTLRANKNLKGKKAEAEESRIDFQLTWNKSPSHDVEESLDVNQGSTEPTQKNKKNSKNNPVPTTESIEKLMLLEVKSVTLAMRSSDNEEVRHPQSSQTLIPKIISKYCTSLKHHFAFFKLWCIYFTLLFWHSRDYLYFISSVSSSFDSASLFKKCTAINYHSKRIYVKELRHCILLLVLIITLT